MELKERAVRGLGWSAIQRWGTQLLQFLIFWILVRLLDPDAFGLVALALVYIAFVQIFLEQGMGQAIVQRLELEPAHLDTAFWINIGSGLTLALAGIGLSGFVAGLFNEPRVQPIVGWLSISLIFYALSSTQQALLERDLDFKSLAIRRLAAQTVGGTAGVVAAFNGLGVWSLVIQHLTAGAVGVIVLWKASNWRPGLRFSLRHFKELFRFGVHIVGINITSFLNTRLDDLLIGSLLGATALGYYTVAYRLLRVLIQLLSDITASVFFPVFARLQNEEDRLRRAFYQATRFTSLFAFPVFMGLVVLAPDLTRTLFGSQWAPSVPVMQILAFTGILQAILRFSHTVVTALGKPNLVLSVRILATIVTAAAFLLVVRYGIVAVALAYTVSSYLLAPLHLWIAYRTIQFDVRHYLSSYGGPLVASLIMMIALLGLQRLLPNWPEPYSLLAIYVVSGAAVYAAAIQLIWPADVKQGFNYVRLLWHKKPLDKAPSGELL